MTDQVLIPTDESFVGNSDDIPTDFFVDLSYSDGTMAIGQNILVLPTDLDRRY